MANLITLAVVAVVAFVVRTYVVQTFYIPSGSMEQTLLVDDQVIVNKAVYRWRGPARGEIVVFRPPASWSAGDEDFIKRVIGVGGDRVICCDDRNRITVNGVALDEDYLYPGDVPSTSQFDVMVPDGRLFVMGDHRSASADSRAHLRSVDGTVPVDRVVGRAFVMSWPVNRWRSLGVPATFAAVPDSH
ncbi:signal peptidase I [Dactylosporangium aurantiacum]|uniref:Signal peptidase I n=1 Tax=Dactylosporangium aurantiacum TaxID=35754 RepID=A0A9Q9IQ35_9ACTN|nr:signal peptidase I [Dactylosporangium aurantiacum]MDG6107949.1 signal peptidase I [Dactylosporangium aurantiacum]UWZ59193.1 signal peptidase I [Dactylosporangium aurantiacum]